VGTGWWRGGARRLARRPALGVALAAGLGLVLAFPPYDAWWLAPVAVAAFTAAVRDRSARFGALAGLTFGLGFFVPLLHWSGIYVGPLPWLLLALSQAAYIAALGAATAVVTGARLPATPLWVAALWVAEEAVRSRAPFGGFPWGRLAFSQGDSPATGLAALGGAPLVTFAIALAGALLASAIPRPIPRPIGQLRGLTWPAAGAAAAVLVMAAGWAVPRPPASPAGGASESAASVTVAIVQGNVPRLGLDFNAQRQAVLRNHVAKTLELARAVDRGELPRPQLVVWPENASDIDPYANRGAAALIDEAARAVGAPVLVGAVVSGPGRFVSNIAIVWDPETGPGQTYLKRHPVPFAEYIPLRPLARAVSDKVDLVARDFAAGDRVGVLDVAGLRAGNMICFEVAYDGLVRDAVRDGAQLIVVQTNNATFGRSGESAQQLAMSRLRAVEHGRTVLVAATSGISAVIAPNGAVVEQSAIFTPDLLVHQVATRDPLTIAARLGSAPEWLLAIVGVCSLAAAALPRLSRRRRPRSPQEVPHGGALPSGSPQRNAANRNVAADDGTHVPVLTEER
jgi:apolipoprotein N-acyltransferase